MRRRPARVLCDFCGGRCGRCARRRLRSVDDVIRHARQTPTDAAADDAGGAAAGRRLEKRQHEENAAETDEENAAETDEENAAETDEAI